MRLHLSFKILTLLAIFTPGRSFAQTAPTIARSVAKAEIPNRILDLTHVEPLSGMPPSTIVGFPQHCSSDGVIFSEAYANADKPVVAAFPDIYSISENREVRIIKLPLPLDYKQLSLRSFYPGRTELVSLIQAAQPINPETRIEKGHKQFFLSIKDRDGGGPKLIGLDLSFEPIKVAIFDSGQLIVLGADPANLQPVLALLDSDGSSKKLLDLDTKNYRSSNDLKSMYESKAKDSNTLALQLVVMGALSQAQFIPWGSEILLVQSGSNFPVYRLRDSGQQEAVEIKPPKGFLLDTILGSNEKDSWVILTKDAGVMEKAAHGEVVENAAERLYEVNPQTGEVIDQLSVKGPHPGELACAANGKVAVTYYGLPEQANIPDQLTYASAPR